MIPNFFSSYHLYNSSGLMQYGNNQKRITIKMLFDLFLFQDSYTILSRYWWYRLFLIVCVREVRSKGRLTVINKRMIEKWFTKTKRWLKGIFISVNIEKFYIA